MYEGNIFERIKDKYDGLSKGNKRIADFIMNSSYKAMYMTAAEIGKACEVSESSVVRFAAKLEYKGFPQLQEAIEKYHDSNADNSVKELVIGFNECARNEIMSLINTYEKLDDNVINTAVSMIEKAKKIYIIGLRESAFVAEHLAYNLKLFAEEVVLISKSNANEIIEDIYRINSKDVLIGISFPNYSYNVLKAMEYASTKQASIVTITDDRHSPMIMYSSCNIFASNHRNMNMDSMIGPLSVVNYILNKLSIRQKGLYEKNMESIKAALTDYNMLGNDEINVL